MPCMKDYDTLQRFLFDDTDIRGEIATLGASYQEIIKLQDYPASVALLLGEFLVAATLISASLKHAAMVTVQVTGDGPVTAMMAECTEGQKLRGIVRGDYSLLPADDVLSLPELIGAGTLAITIEPDQGERYQGIVKLESEDLSGCLEHYFNQSAQLLTKIKLASCSGSASGILIQQMPVTQDHDKALTTWQHLTTMMDTLKTAEQIDLSHNDQLYRLFHQDNVRLFEAKKISFFCSCSLQRTVKALSYIGIEELLETVAEQEFVQVTCQFCAQNYQFGEAEIKAMFKPTEDIIH
ncbi:MAG: Hsp33 family molecular chaperone HslO [Porticoccaceae bacterium]|nr:Hsp33 family molecular chaperone HslO [Porticoccaceae bacterium]